MLRGCVFALILYGLLAAGYFCWFDTVFEPPATYIGAGVAGFLVLCCIGAVTNARTALRDWFLLSRSQDGLRPEEGRLVAIAGTVHPTGSPLVAPFSRSECVLCEYGFADQARISAADDSDSAGCDYTGFLMCPCVIRSRSGDVRLLGFPLLEGFEEMHCSAPAHARNALEFLSNTPFEDRTGLKMVSLFSVFGDVWTDEDGLVEKNMQLRRADLDQVFPPRMRDEFATLDLWEKANLHSNEEGDNEDEDEDDDDLDADEEGGERFTSKIPKMTEKRVAVGEEVCAIGIFDEMRRGLRPPSRTRTPNRLLRGSLDETCGRLRSSFLGHLVGALIGLVVIHAAIYGVMQLYR